MADLRDGAEWLICAVWRGGWSARYGGLVDLREVADRPIYARPGALSVGSISGLCQAPDNIRFGVGLFGALPERSRFYICRVTSLARVGPDVSAEVGPDVYPRVGARRRNMTLYWALISAS